MNSVFYALAIVAIVAGCGSVLFVTLSAHRARREREYARAVSAQALWILGFELDLKGPPEAEAFEVFALAERIAEIGYFSNDDPLLADFAERRQIKGPEATRLRTQFMTTRLTSAARPLRLFARHRDTPKLTKGKSVAEIPLEIYASDRWVQSNLLGGLALIDAATVPAQARRRRQLEN